MKKIYKKTKLENLMIKSFVTKLETRELKGGDIAAATRGCSYEPGFCE